MLPLQPFFHLPNPIPPTVPVGPLDTPRIQTLSPYDDEFDTPQISGKWVRSGKAAQESFDDKIRSALYLQFTGSQTDITFAQHCPIIGDFSATLCCSIEMTANTHNLNISVSDLASANAFGVQCIYSSGAKIRTTKVAASVFSQVDITSTLTFEHGSSLLLHIQRSGNNWTGYY